ncbi:MAG: EAL domain-containing protein [Microlunatus sp.]|nr:EAL domain-containing protein [Microlunatus sp.]
MEEKNVLQQLVSEKLSIERTPLLVSPHVEEHERLESQPSGSTIPRSPVGAVQHILDDQDLLWVEVQPLVDLERGSVAGYECLARCPKHWGIGPDALFAAATMLGVAGRLQRHIIHATLALRESAPCNTFLTLNVEPPDLLDDSVVATLLEYGDLRRVVVEVTERGWPERTDRLVEALDRLREAGALVALDDAGTGHSDLARLMALRPDIVKLDHKLVTDLDTEVATRSMVSMMGELCGRLDSWLLVEGIERIEQLRVLAQLRVPLGQGYLLGEPQPPWPQARVPLEQRIVLEEAALSECLVSLLQHPRDLARLGVSSGIGEMAMAPMTKLPDALRRALNRPEATRFSPIVVTDPRGKVVGEVVMDRLMLAALDLQQDQSSNSSI